MLAWDESGEVHKSHIFRSYDHPRLATTNKNEHRFNDEPASLARIWKVARATSAAPGYFSEQDIERSTYKDGGLGANNPAFLIFQDIKQMQGDKFPEIIVSIGTGTKVAGTGTKVAEAGYSTPKERAKKSNGRNPLKSLRSMYHTFRDLPAIATDAETDHKKLKDTIDLAKGERQRRDPTTKLPLYFTFNVDGLGAAVELDEWVSSNDSSKPNGNETLRDLKKITETYLSEPEVLEKLQDCAIELVHIHRKRAKTERWEKYATQAVYNCSSGDICRPVGLASREELRRHAFEQHELVTRSTCLDERVCTLDECALNPVRFPGREAGDSALIKHLKIRHKLKNPTLKSPEELEAWLDERRNDRQAATQQGGLAGNSMPRPQRRDSPEDMKDPGPSWAPRWLRSRDIPSEAEGYAQYNRG